MIRTNNAKTLAVLLAATVALLVALAGPALAVAKFLPARYYPTGPFPVSATSADFNGDGRGDLATANRDSNGQVNPDTVSVLLANADGTFGAKRDFPSGGTSPRSVKSADFDADGDKDLAVVHFDDDKVSVLRNDGTGSFGAPQNYPVPGCPSSVETADLTGDGKADLAVANPCGSSGVPNGVYVMANNGTGAFASPVGYAAGPNTGDVAAGDFDADGDRDLASSDTGDNNVHVFLNTGAGSFQKAGVSALDDTSSSASIVAADFDGDSRDDLAVSRFATHVLRSTGGGAFSAPVEYNASGSYDSVAGDFDADGDADVANVDGSNFGTVAVLPNNGSGAVGAIQRFESRGNPQGVATGDFDGDRDADLAAANAAGGTLGVLLSDVPPPAVTKTTPAGKKVAPTASATAAFNTRMDEASVEAAGALQLVKKGTTAPLAATVLYDPAKGKATLDPKGKLRAGQTYTATVRGGPAGVRDLLGRPMAGSKSWSFTVKR